MADLIDGKKISQDIKDEVRDKVTWLKEKKNIEVSLAVILVGNDPASTVYVNNKKKACEYTGIKSVSYELPEETTEEDFDLESDYDSYNEDVMANLKKKLNNVPGKRNFDGLVNKGKSRAYQLAKIGRTLGNKATKQAKDTRGYISSRAKLLKRKINK